MQPQSKFIDWLAIIFGIIGMIVFIGLTAHLIYRMAVDIVALYTNGNV